MLHGITPSYTTNLCLLPVNVIVFLTDLDFVFLQVFSRFVQVKMTFLPVHEHGNSIKFHKNLWCQRAETHHDTSRAGFFVNIYIFWHLHHTFMIQHIYSTLPLRCTNIVQVLSWNLQYVARCTHTHAKKYFERKNTIGWSQSGPITSRVLFDVWVLPSVYFRQGHR